MLSLQLQAAELRVLKVLLRLLGRCHLLTPQAGLLSPALHFGQILSWVRLQMLFPSHNAAWRSHRAHPGTAASVLPPDPAVKNNKRY